MYSPVQGRAEMELLAKKTPSNTHLKPPTYLFQPAQSDTISLHSTLQPLKIWQPTKLNLVRYTATA